MSKFLSEEWISEAGDVLNGHAGFSGAIANVDLGLQFQVTETGGDDVAYYLNIGGGTAEMAPGELDGADVTVANDYETAVAVSKGELNTQMAFMQGKLKVSGNMAKLMMHQAVINEFASALASMDTDY